MSTQANRNSESRDRWIPPRAAAWAPQAAFLLATLAVVAVRGPGAETLETVEKSAGDWMKLRVEAKRLESAWQEERTLVESLLVALKERAATAEEKSALMRAKTAREREELETLRQKISAEGGELRAFDPRLKALGEKLLALRPALPPRLSDALEMAFRSLANRELPLGERMQLTASVLNRCAQFNQGITVGEEVVTPDGGAEAKSLEVIYWGLSHGYAIDRPAKKAWLGAPRDGAWRWEPKPEAFDGLVRLLAIATDKADPEFIVVPAGVDELLPANPPATP